jgi:hypothetical protein
MTIINFARKKGSKDKKKRKRSGILTGVTAGTLGAGIGYSTKPSKYNLIANKLYRKNLKKLEKDLVQLTNKKQLSSTEKDGLDWTTQKINNFKTNKNQIIKDNITRTKYFEIEDMFKPYINKISPKYNALSNKIGKKRGLIGAGIGLTTGLGGSYLYNKFRNKNDKQ